MAIQLTRLACHFPNSGHTTNSLKVVAEDWYEEFKWLSDSRFIETMKKVKRKSRFFPVIADISDAEKAMPMTLEERKHMENDVKKRFGVKIC